MPRAFHRTRASFPRYRNSPIPDQLASLDPKNVLLIALGCFALFYVFILGRAVFQARRDSSRSAERPELLDTRVTPARAGIGAITDFLDTLGIGSFATTTSLFRFTKMVPDELMPGTLNVRMGV